MGLEFLKSLVIVLGVSALVVFLLHRLKIPSIVGFLVAGAIIGPYGIGVLKDVHSIEIMAEIGVVLLLFTIGIEFSMARLIRIRKAVIAGGGIQVLLTIALSAAAAYLVTGNANRSVFWLSNSLKQHCNCFKDACRKRRNRLSAWPHNGGHTDFSGSLRCAPYALNPFPVRRGE